MMQWPGAEFYREEDCKRCGVCCRDALSSSPCEHLAYEGTGRYRCAIYPNRLGWHSTLNGRQMQCVPIKFELESGGGPIGCAYLAKLEKFRAEQCPRH